MSSRKNLVHFIALVCFWRCWTFITGEGFRWWPTGCHVGRKSWDSRLSSQWESRLRAMRTRTRRWAIIAELSCISLFGNWVRVEICSFRSSKSALIYSSTSSEKIRLLLVLMFLASDCWDALAVLPHWWTFSNVSFDYNSCHVWELNCYKKIIQIMKTWIYGLKQQCSCFTMLDLEIYC